MLLCTTIRGLVNVADATARACKQDTCRGPHTPYKWWVLRRRGGGERWPGWRAAQAPLQASTEQDPQPREAHAKPSREVSFRLDRALVAFACLHRVGAGEASGFQRMRHRLAVRTLCD